MGILGSLKKGIEEGKREQKAVEWRKGIQKAVRQNEKEEREIRAPPSKVGRVIGRAAAGKPGQVIGKIANTGAQTVGKAVVVGGSRLKAGVVAGAKQGLENYAINKGMVPGKKAGKPKRSAAGFIDAIGMGGPFMGTQGGPGSGMNLGMIGVGLSDDLIGGPRPQPKKKHKKHRGGGQAIHVHVHTAGERDRNGPLF